MVYGMYTNRYGKRLFLFRSLLEKFQAMKADLLAQGIDIEMTDAWRGRTEQEKAYETGHSKAHFGLSPHNFGAAFDVVPVVDGDLTWDVDDDTWNAIATAGKNQGLVWGGDFHSIVDKPHFEIAGWRDMNLTLLPEAPKVVGA